MVSYVRIAPTPPRVRLGAYIGEGTTVMHEGFVNFNAGTEARSMEGRVSAGVFVGKGSDPGRRLLGHGHPLSGGGNIVISVGELPDQRQRRHRHPLGDRNIVEAGLHHRRHQGRPARRAELW